MPSPLALGTGFVEENLFTEVDIIDGFRMIQRSTKIDSLCLQFTVGVFILEKASGFWDLCIELRLFPKEKISVAEAKHFSYLHYYDWTFCFCHSHYNYFTYCETIYAHSAEN